NDCSSLRTAVFARGCSCRRHSARTPSIARRDPEWVCRLRDRHAACSTCAGCVMTPRARSTLLCAAWVVWVAIVVTHYFTIPADRFHVFEGPIGFPRFWREAAVRGVLAIGAAAAVTLAAWTLGHRLSRWFLSGLVENWLQALVFQLALGFACLS